jgi:hypothetical protein
MSQRWPVHPPPREFDILEHWIGELAAAYGVSKLTFCCQALGLKPQEIALLRDNPPEQALRKLEAGTGVPLQQLQDMTIHTLFRRMTQALERIRQEDPEGFAALERQFVHRAPHPAPAASS